MLKGKKIVLGITGSIAAYKACVIIRLLRKQGAEVQVVITPSGKEFITPITLSALSQRPVISDFFAQRDGTWHSHVDLGLWADAMLIAPCTASTIGKMANGIADNMLITTYLSMKAPVFVAPAMDLDMFAHPSTTNNLKKLRSYGNIIIEPQTGFLASGLEGKGRMQEPDIIIDTIDRLLTTKNNENKHLTSGLKKQTLYGKKILITAGPTYEKIDPVRFIGNYSSGKMGFAIANECNARGAEVTLIAGPVKQNCDLGINRINVETAVQMLEAAEKYFKQTDVAILCAAVADYRPTIVEKQKIKRKDDNISINLVANPDIAATIGKHKQPHQKIIGFALETSNEETNAEEKLKKKNLDFIVLNSLNNKGTCFGTDENKITIISRTKQKIFDKNPKTQVAKDIVDEIELL